MSGNEIDARKLKQLLGVGETETPEPTPFARGVAEALTKALVSLRAEGIIEVEDANLGRLTADIIDTALESSSVKRLPLRIVNALIHSDFAEEVYGTNEEIAAALQPFLEEI